MRNKEAALAAAESKARELVGDAFDGVLINLFVDIARQSTEAALVVLEEVEPKPEPEV